MFKYIKKPWKVNSSRKYLAEFAQRAAESIPNDSRVLDAGAGDTPYKSYFKLARYHATDLRVVEKSYGQLSYICDLNNIPICSDYYDLVFCSQTLEHVPDPKTVIGELERVLKPGGHLWLTAPFYYEEHEAPYDYYRYTQFGLRYTIINAGFHLESIEWLEGYFGALAYQLKLAAKALPMSPKEFGSSFYGWLLFLPVGFIKIFFAILTIFFSWLDVRAKYVSRGHCKNYAAIAVKPFVDGR
jgi:SAM-dependent methyltransferase